MYIQFYETYVYNLMYFLYFNLFIYKGSLNETYDDEVAGIKFAILFDDLADHFPEEKFQKLKDLIQSNVSRFACC